MASPSIPNLMCFQHCVKNVNVFCFVLPALCPMCGEDLSTADLRIPPFRVALPFSTASNNPHHVVLKPTNGNFLRDYKNGQLLHVGLTDSRGRVYEFDERGLTCDDANGWTQCLAASIRRLEPCDIDEIDRILSTTVSSPAWKAEKYNEELYNCFDYVLYVVNAASSGQPSSKTSFVSDLICPLISKAMQVVALYRATDKNGFHISHNSC